MAYDQFEGYDLSNPYPTVNEGWYRVDDQRREDRREFEAQRRYQEQDNYRPERKPFEMDWD